MWQHQEEEQSFCQCPRVYLQGPKMMFRFKQRARGICRQAFLDKTWSCPSALSELQSFLRETQQAFRTMQNLFARDKTPLWLAPGSLPFLSHNMRHLKKLQFLGVHCFNGLVAKEGHGTSVSLENLPCYLDSHRPRHRQVIAYGWDGSYFLFLLLW